jgi:hypothetical protein
MDAIDLLARYAGADSDQKLYAAGEKVPVECGHLNWPRLGGLSSRILAPPGW